MAKTSWIMFLNCLLISFLIFVWFCDFRVLWFLNNWYATVLRNTQWIRTEYQSWILLYIWLFEFEEVFISSKRKFKMFIKFLHFLYRRNYIPYVYFLRYGECDSNVWKVYRRVLLLRACIELYEAHMVKFELKPRIAKFHFFRSYKRWTLSETSLQKY